MDLARAPRRRPLTARKKGSGYENGIYPYIYIDQYQRWTRARGKGKAREKITTGRQ